jgi:hemolysin activation/secretion protein
LQEAASLTYFLRRLSLIRIAGREYSVLKKRYLPSFISLSFICFGLFTETNVHADSINHYFESNDSASYENKNISSSNRNDNNPVITVTRFDISRLKSLDQYDIVQADLEEIIKKDQKENNSRYTIDRLEHLAENLSLYYKKRGLILAKVYFPPQSAKNNSLYLDLVLGEIESVTTKKNDYYSKTRLTRPFKDILDQPAYIPTLESSLIELNSYPGIRLETHFREGSSLGKTQIDIHVKDEEISDFNFSFDNYGSKYTGAMRVMLKGNFYNLADQADQLNINVLATLNPTNSLYLGSSYRFKIAPYFSSSFLNSAFRHGWHGTIGYQQTEYVAGGEIEAIKYEGEANTLFLKLDKDLILRNSHKLNTGFVFSKKEAITRQSGDENPADKLSIFTWTTQFRWNDYIGNPSANLIKFDYHQGLPGVAGARENGDPDISRVCFSNGQFPLAPMDYQRFNLLFTRNQNIGPYQFISSLNLQYTEDLLIASELSNLGGSGSVRGYKNSDFTGDRTSVVSFELVGRSNARKLALPISDLKLAGFIDYGQGERLSPLGSEQEEAEMLSVGGYAQFLKEGKFSSKIELAIPLIDVGESEKQGIEVLFNFERGF